MMPLLKLADKYQVDGIRALCVARLEEDWPTTWRAWYRQQADIDFVQRMSDYRNPEEASFVDSVFPEPASAICIALEHDIPDILPAALYCLSQLEIKDDWDRYNGRSFKFWTGGRKPSWPTPAEEGRRTARWMLLDKDTLHSVLWARDALSLRAFQLIEFFVPRMTPVCVLPKCRDGIKQVAELNALLTKPKGDEQRDPLGKLMEMHTLVTGASICCSCEFHLRAEIENEMQTVWDELPQLFCIEQLRSGKPDRQKSCQHETESPIQVNGERS